MYKHRSIALVPSMSAGAAALVLVLAGLPSSALAQSSEDPVIEGVFDVGGHGLYLSCQGTGEPTIVYLHGAIWDRQQVPLPHANGEFAQRALADEYRVCVYDRRNVGRSDIVDAPQLPVDVIADLHGLLAAAEVEPPYLLLGASYGGLLAYLYANEYPEDVVGMLLLDSLFPDEMSLQYLFPPEDRQEAFVVEDEEESPERTAQFKVYEAAQAFIGHEPAIPVTYLSSIPQGFDVNDFGIPEYNEQVLELQKGYVERFSPGRYLRVDSPHFMERAIPDQVVQKLRRVIEQAGY